MSYLLAIDPGLSSGIFLGHYSDTDPLTRVGVWQFGGVSDEVRGAEALLEWLAHHTQAGDDEGITEFDYYGGFVAPGLMVEWPDLVTVAEKFTPLQGKGFSLTLDAVEPLRCEGALIAKGFMPAEFPHECWQRPDRMVLAGGNTPAQRKKASDDFLRKNGFWCTGKDVGQPDADDAISATKHALAYVKKIAHTPSLQQFWTNQ